MGFPMATMVGGELAESERLFKAMADGTRRRVLALLARQELSVSELVELLRQPQSTVSRHLKVLRQSGLMVDRREGQVVLCSVPAADLEDAGLRRRLLDWVAEEPLGSGLEARLLEVLARRREGSARFFGSIGRRWDAVREEAFGRVFQWEAFVSLLPARWTVADIGTGTGTLLPVLGDHFRQVVGVDPYDAMLDAARRRLASEGVSNVSLVRGDLAALPLADGVIDLGLAMLVLHHMPSPDVALAELGRVLSPGGMLMIVEQRLHDSESFQARMHDLVRGFEPEELTARLNEAGFTECRHRSLHTVDRGDDAPQLYAMVARKPGG